MTTRSMSHSKLRKKFSEMDECSYCCKKRYWKKDCPKLVKDKEKQGSTTKYGTHRGEDYDIALVGLLAISHTDEWFWIQIAPTTCLNRKSFFRLEELEGGIIYMVNDIPCKIKEICEV